MYKLHVFTGLAWDNYDLNLETLDGKESLHVTVGIAYQNLILGDVPDVQNVTYLSERSRRRYDGAVKVIPPFHKNLKTTSTSRMTQNRTQLAQTMWLQAVVRTP